MRKITKILSVIALCCLMVLSIGLVGCVNSGKFEFTKALPERITFNSEIYFRDYISTQFGAEYELYASYYDPDEQVQVTDEKQESLMFRFDKVTDYSFAIKKVGGGELKCDIDCYPELPRFNTFSEYSAIKGDYLVLSDLLYWCRVTLKNENTVVSDPSYRYVFEDVTVKSLVIDGQDKKIDLSNKNLSDVFTFEEEAIYEFSVKTVGKAGETKFTITANTSNDKYHKNEVTGYVYDADDKIEFTMPQAVDVDEPSDGKTVKVRMGDTVGTAVYNAEKSKYVVSSFTKEVNKGEPVRLLVGGEKVTYSVMVVAPDLVLTQQNFRLLETATTGYIVLNEDIDMGLIEYTEKEIEDKRAYWGGARASMGSYEENYFTGYFDGQDHTISNFVTGGASYSCGLFWSADGATIKNINFEKAIVNGYNSVVCGRATRKAKFENIAVEVSSIGNKNASIITGPTEMDIEYKNILMYVESMSAEPTTGASFFGAFYTNTILPSNVYCITDTNLPLLPSHISIDAKLLGEVNKFTRSDAMNGVGINIDQMPTALLRKAYDKLFINYMTKIDSSNIGLLQTATAGEYWLTEDIDFESAFNGEWAPTSTFLGTLDGKGYTIKNFNGSSLFAGFGGTIKDVNFIDVTFNGAKGFISGVSNVSRDVVIENAIFSFKEINAKSWASLLGYQTGGIATLRNVFIEMPASNDDFRGFITCHAITGLELDQVYMTGGNQSIHSTSLKNSTNYTLDNPTYGKGMKGEKDKDYFIFASNGDLTLDESITLPENIQKAFDTGLLDKMVVEITADNIGELQNAENGYYFLMEDVDFATAFTGTWTPSTTFAGVLEGNGFTISNFTGDNLFKGFTGTIRNINFDNVTFTGSSGFLSLDKVTVPVFVENAVFEFTTISNGSWTGLVGYLTGGVANLKNTFIQMPTTTLEYKGFISCNAGTGYVLDQVYMTGGNGNVHSPSSGNNQNYVYDDPTYGKGFEGELNKDYFIYTSNAELTLDETVVLPENIQKAFDNGMLDKMVTKITAANIGELQNAESGLYILMEDIDFATAFTGAWTPTTTFAGVLDGNGYTISNFNGSNLFKGFTGTVKNINFDNVTFTGQKGFLSADNVTVPVYVENAVFEFTTISYGSWSALVGCLAGGVANVKNTYIQTPSSTSEYRGFISCNSATGYVLDQVYMVGGNGSIHSTSASNNQNYVPDNPTHGKGFVGELGKDYFIFTSTVELLIDETIVLPENIKKAFDDGIVTTDLVKINANNFASLQSATEGYYLLTEDIDFATVITETWTPSTTFAGVLDGDGYTISNFNGSNLFKGFTGTVKNVNFDNVTFTGQKGFLSAENVNTVVRVENVVFDFTKVSGSWAGLVGYLTGGVANIKNTYIQMPASSSDQQGFISCNAGTGYVLDQVYMVGGTGSVHSTSSKNNSNYDYDNPTYGKGFVGELNKDYFIVLTAEQIVYELGVTLPKNIQTAIDNNIINLNVIEITSANVGVLQTATNGYYVITEDIDLKTVDLNGDGNVDESDAWKSTSAFAGVIIGNGKTISGLTTISGGGGFIYTNNGTIKNINISVDVLAYNSGVFGRIGNGAVLEGVNVAVKRVTDRNSGLFMAVQGDITIKNVHVYFDKVSVDNSTGGFICGSAITPNKYITVSGLYMYGGQEVVGTASQLVQVVGLDGLAAVDGKDYYLKNTDLANAVSLAPKFIKDAYEQANNA